jgi:hypothetical protein
MMVLCFTKHQCNPKIDQKQAESLRETNNSYGRKNS